MRWRQRPAAPAAPAAAQPYPAALRPADRGAAQAEGETRLPYGDISKQRRNVAAPRRLTDPYGVFDFVTRITVATQATAAARTASRPLAGGAAQEILHLVAIGARQLELVAALEGEEILTVHVRTQ